MANLLPPPNLNPLQLCNFQTGYTFKFSDLSIQEIGKKACESLGFFYNYRIAISELLDFFVSANPDSKEHQEILKSIEHCKELTTSFISPFAHFNFKIRRIKNIFEKKDTNNLDFNNDPEYSEFCELVKSCFEQLNLFDDLKEESFKLLGTVKKELNEFIKVTKKSENSSHNSIKIPNERLGYFDVGLNKDERLPILLYCFRVIFYILYKNGVPWISSEKQIFFQNNKTLIDSFDKFFEANLKGIKSAQQTPRPRYYSVYDFIDFDSIEFENHMILLIDRLLGSFEDLSSIFQEYLHRLEPFLNKGEKE